jgi:hypothetical protein
MVNYSYNRQFKVASEPEWEIEKASEKHHGTKVELTAFLTSAGDKKKIELDLPDVKTSLSVEKRSVNRRSIVGLSDYYDWLGDVDYAKLNFKITELTVDAGYKAVDVFVTLHAEGGPFECGKCEGEGRIRTFTDEFSHSSGHYTKDTSYECEDCNGTGEINIDEDFSISVKPEPEIDQERGTWIPATYKWVGEPA